MIIFQVFKILFVIIVFFLLFRLLMLLLDDGQNRGRKRAYAGERERRAKSQGVIELGKDQYKVE